MRKTILAAILMTGLLLSSAAAQQPALPRTEQTDVPVRAVVLFSSGVGYFEHFGTVRDDGTTELRFTVEQINDILKSLLLQDLDGGAVHTVTYPSHDPLEKTLRSFQIDISRNPPLADLLQQLRVATVTVEYRDDRLTGTVLGVEFPEKVVDDHKIVEPLVHLLIGGSIRSVWMDEVREWRIEDPRLQEELARALAAVAQARDQDKKPVNIRFEGEGERRVRIGYVIESPIWKTSYRLVFDNDDDAQALLQGWAIVENQTENDWHNVQLSLVSGRPISFIQDLYQPLYAQRPVVQPELFAGLRPRLYRPGVLRPAERATAARGGAGGGIGGVGRGGTTGRAGGRPEAILEMDASAPADGRLDPAASVAALATAAQLGELFEYTVPNVTLARQTSAMLPVITDDVQVERLSIYNQQVLANNPLNGARITNTTDKHLLQGPVTVLDANAYAGDAQLDNLPPGEDRLLSYGVDLKMLINAKNERTEQRIQTARIVRGTLLLTNRHVATQDYLIQNRADADRTLLIEHPRRNGWDLADTPDPAETTDDLYRFRTSIPAGESETFTIKQQRISSQSIAILPADLRTLQSYHRSGEIPAEVREALARAMQMRQAIVETERQITQRQQRIEEITSDQRRIRDNMRTIDRNTQYYNRLLNQLNDQETELEQLRQQIDELRDQLQGQQRELEDYLDGLTI